MRPLCAPTGTQAYVRTLYRNGLEPLSMDAPHLSTPDAPDPIDLFDVALRKERDGVREFLAAKQRQLDEVHNRLFEYLDQLAREAAGGRHAAEAARHDVDERAAQLAEEAERFEQCRADLDARRAEWQQVAQQTTQHHQALLQTLGQEQQALQQRRAELERQQAECAETDRAERESVQRQLHEARGEQERLERELAAQHARCEALQRELAAARVATEELDALRHERDSLAASLREAEVRLEQAQKQVDHAENRLLTRLGQFADDLAAGYRPAEAVSDPDQQAARFAHEAEHLEQLRTDLEARRAEWQRTAEETARYQESLLETLRQEQRALQQQRAALEQQQAALEQRQASLEQRQAERTEAERAERESLLQALRDEQHALEQQRARLQQQQAAFERRQAECAQVDRAERESLQQQLAAARSEKDRLEAELAVRREQCDALKQEAGAAKASAKEMETLTRERDALAASLREAEERLERAQRESAELERRVAASVETAAGEQASADADLRRRYELTLEDLRALKGDNARLQEQLKETQSAPPAGPPASSGPLDWEAEKQRILAALESDFDEEHQEDRRQRTELQQIVERTDQVIAEKDAEIAELKQLLENQSASVGALAVGAAALDEIFDKDAVIQEERQNLAQLQEEWREKLRQAEVDLSVERAKLARQRTEVEEKLCLLEERGAKNDAPPTGGAVPEKPPRSRWLNRLGLKDPKDGS